MKLSLLAAASLTGALVLSSLSAADSPASTPAPAPAAASASASGTANTAKTGTAPATSSTMAPSDAAKPDLTKLPPASDKKDLTYDKDILPILKASCTGCHIANQRPSGGIDLSTLATALKGGRTNKDKDIVPGHGDQSFVLLYAADLVTKMEMPPLRKRTGTPPVPALTKEQLGLLRAWIDQGAK